MVAIYLFLRKIWQGEGKKTIDTKRENYEKTKMRKTMEILGYLLTGIVAGTITAILLLVVTIIIDINRRIMKK